MSNYDYDFDYDVDNTELKSHKKSDKVKWIITAIAFVLVFVFIAGLCMQLFAKDELKPSNWGKKPEAEQTEEGVVIPESVEGTGISLLNASIPIERYSEYDVSPIAESAYTLTATVTPEYASDKSVDYSIVWADPASAWASGKNVIDYLSLSQPNVGGLIALLSCKEAFGEQAVITVTARSNRNATAKCTVDYKQRYIGISTTLRDPDPTEACVNFSTAVNGGSITANLPNTDEYSGDFMSARFNLEKSSVYTIPVSGTANVSYYVKPTAAFVSALEMQNTMVAAANMTISKDWTKVTSAEIDLTESGMDFSFAARYEQRNYISRYLSFLVSNISQDTNGYFTDQYVHFANAVKSVNGNPMEKGPHFEIKIVTTIDDKTTEAITAVTFKNVTFPAKGVSTDSSVVF